MKHVLGGFALIGAWVIAVFGAAIPSGWVHLPLAAGVVLIAIGIVRGNEGNSDDGGTGTL